MISSMTLYEIEKKCREVDSAIGFTERVLSGMPEGSLYTRNQYGGVRYYYRKKGETSGRYLGRGKEETIRLLEKKAYYTELSRALKKEKKELEHLKAALENLTDYKSVFLRIAQEKRHLITPYENTPTPDEWVRLFNKKPVSEAIKFISQNGEHVRSKSELIIADRLKAAGVPYYYEDPLILAEDHNPGTLVECLYWHPDFRVQNIRTGRQYYWEHFGMLDNPDYCKSSQEKLEIYAQYGYFPGENLIITFESSNHGLNMKYVDCLIEKYLI